MINYVRNELFHTQFHYQCQTFLYAPRQSSCIIYIFYIVASSLSITHLLCALLIIITINFLSTGDDKKKKKTSSNEINNIDVCVYENVYMRVS